MSQDANPLFQTFKLGDLELPNRIVMAPLTRNRAVHESDAPYELNALYYAQRASAGLVISEATQISQQGQGYLWTPGIYTDAQIAGWRIVTKKVHVARGRIFVQLWHVGRVSHTSLQKNDAAPVAPSAIVANTKAFVKEGFVDASMPHALTQSEIHAIIADYANAALNTKRADFDGIEIHGANGYLIDQFLKNGPNHRADDYGGSIENRARFGLEVVDAIARVYPKNRVGMRISPVSPANDAVTSDPNEIFGYFVAELAKRRIAYIHVIEGATGGLRDNVKFDYRRLRKAFNGAYIANNGYTRELAIDEISEGKADLIAFGKAFIANPDLVERLRINAPLNEPNANTFYGGGAEGYTDYSTLLKAAE